MTETDDRTLQQTAGAAGLDEAYLRRHLLAAGLPVPAADEPAFSDEDVAALRAVKALLDAGAGEDAVLDLVRASGRGAASVAAVAAGHGVGADALLPALGEAPLRWHLRAHAQRAAVEAEERAAGRLEGAREVAVGFAGLVAAPRAGAAATRWERLAADTAQAPVDLVKLTGDAALLVSPDPLALVETLWALVGAAAADRSLPAARAGAAFGPARPQGGDWYGGPVDLADRITGAAEPGSVVADDALARRTSEAVTWVPAGVKRLAETAGPVQLYRLRAEPVGAGG
jgi:adenylate cyclase